MISCFGKSGECTDRVSNKRLEILNSGYVLDMNDDMSANRPDGRSDYQLVAFFGRGYVTLNERRREMRAGDALLFRPHERQDYGFYKGSSYGFIHFSGTECREILSGLGLDETVYRKRDGADYKNGIVKMSDCFYDKREGAELFGIGILLSLLAALGEDFESSRFAPAVKAAGSSDSFRLTVAQMAEMCDMSEYHFSRQFKHEYGRSPRDFVLDTIVEKSKMLLTGGMKVASVAEQFGFTDPFYFSRVFKQRTGLSPSEFGKNN